jgi:hypothetical protein
MLVMESPKRQLITPRRHGRSSTAILRGSCHFFVVRAELQGSASEQKRPGEDSNFRPADFSELFGFLKRLSPKIPNSQPLYRLSYRGK